MAKNGYFQLECEENKIRLRVFPPEEGGRMFTTEDVIQYLDAISFSEYDVVGLDGFLQQGDFDDSYLLSEGEMIPEAEKCIVTITENGERALARFFPPSTGGSRLTEEDIVSDLQHAGVKHGIRKKAIQHFLESREYCRDYIMAEATYPVHGYDASIEYFFDVNATAKPKLNEDGSVDFHHLGNIAVVEEGAELAALKPADRGRKGISVKGTPMPPKKVKVLHLRYGRNIRISEDKCHLYADVPGYVTLVEDMVMLSDIYRVPANVDASTGDIEFNGTVEVAGNVNTGYNIDATGDIIVNGVAEGAVLKAGGNIVLKRGMQGMERGELQAGGNITAKFLENCKVKCEGSLKADAVLHSEVSCKDTIEVRGKKGLINGGYVKTYAAINATSLGSTMGSNTKVEVMSDKELILRKKDLKENIREAKEKLDKIDKVAEAVKAQLAAGKGILPEQHEYIRQATKNKPALKKEIRELEYEVDSLQDMIDRNKNACIKVEKDVFSGVKLMVKDAMRIQNEHLVHCRFVRDGADVKMEGL